MSISSVAAGTLTLPPFNYRKTQVPDAAARFHAGICASDAVQDLVCVA